MNTPNPSHVRPPFNDHLSKKGVTMRIRQLITLSLVVLMGVLLLTSPALADPEGQGIVVVPPSSQIQAEIHLARSSFQVGTPIQIFFSVSQKAYVNIVDIDATGTCTLIFPNAFSNNNLVNAGQHVLPDRPTYNLIVTPPAGTEFVQIIASLEPLDLRTLFNSNSQDPFPTLCNNPQTFAQQVKNAIQGIVAVGKIRGSWSCHPLARSKPKSTWPAPASRSAPRSRSSSR